MDIIKLKVRLTHQARAKQLKRQRLAHNRTTQLNRNTVQPEMEVLHKQIDQALFSLDPTQTQEYQSILETQPHLRYSRLFLFLAQLVVQPSRCEHYCALAQTFLLFCQNIESMDKDGMALKHTIQSCLIQWLVNKLTSTAYQHCIVTFLEAMKHLLSWDEEVVRQFLAEDGIIQISFVLKILTEKVLFQILEIQLVLMTSQQLSDQEVIKFIQQQQYIFLQIFQQHHDHHLFDHHVLMVCIHQLAVTLDHYIDLHDQGIRPNSIFNRILSLLLRFPPSYFHHHVFLNVLLHFFRNLDKFVVHPHEVVLLYKTLTHEPSYHNKKLLTQKLELMFILLKAYEKVVYLSEGLYFQILDKTCKDYPLDMDLKVVVLELSIWVFRQQHNQIAGEFIREGVVHRLMDQMVGLTGGTQVFTLLFSLIEFIYDFCLEYDLHSDQHTLILVQLAHSHTFWTIAQQHQELLDDKYDFWKRFDWE